MTAVRAASCAAALLALATLAAGVHWGSTVAGGADSYGYVSQAASWRSGTLTIREPIARQSPWPFALQTWAPLGYRAAPGRRDAIVPLYPPGFPMIMALFQAVGGFCAAFLVVPICGALTVWLSYVLGRRLFGTAATALIAAVLTATSPIFLFQLMNPMSDVPATAGWALALVLSAADWPAAAGVAAGVALLIRPNLVLCAVVIFAWTAAARRRPARFVLGLLPAVLAIGSINEVLYGAPWTSGYGSLSELYDVREAATNLHQFAGWIVETQTPLMALALVYLVFPRMAKACIPYPRLFAGGMMAAVLLSYLFYIPFDAWWYLRFLLPMWPVAMVLVAAAVAAIVERPARFWRAASIRRTALAIAVAAMAANGLRIAAARSTFDVGRGERKYVDIARFIASRTEPDAVVISLQHSGTLRLYAGRLTLRFDQLDGKWLDRTVAFLGDRGRHPFIVVERAELDLFRRRFAGNEAGRLDWRPLATSADPDIFVYDALERPTAGEPLAIGLTVSRQAGWRCDPPYAGRMPLRTE